MRLPLYARLGLFVTLLAATTGLGMATLAIWTNHHYHQEATQQLHRDLADYVLAHQPDSLLKSPSAANHEALKGLAKHIMMINPLVEVFLVNRDGNIMGHALPEGTVQRQRIDIQPVQKWLSNPWQGPVEGTNPRFPDQTSIFSAAPITDASGSLLGYLYIVLASQDERSLLEALRDSAILRLGTGGLLLGLLLLALSSWLAFHRISAPLSRLAKEASHYRSTSLSPITAVAGLAPVHHPEGNNSVYAVGNQDEIRLLECSFRDMKDRIQTQFDQIQHAERIHRELITNVSHDLRTPLAAMQGYLETLIIKGTTMSHQAQAECLQVAHRHSRKLARLIAQLFELSKLESGCIHPHLEAFSLLELLYDTIQEFQLQAQQKGISLEVRADAGEIQVMADIALIQRVLQNLLENGIRHTAAGGTIVLMVTQSVESATVTVQDDGPGIPSDELPYVFQRYYQSGHNKRLTSVDPDQGAGLGLAIVKKLLELQRSAIRVTSTPGEGTSFRFDLPRTVPA